MPGSAAVVGRRTPVRVLQSADTWLPMPAEWAGLTVEKQSADPDSTLSFFARALELRRSRSEFSGDDIEWLPESIDALAFRRGGGLTCALNAGEEAIALPAGGVIFSSAPLVDGKLPPDAAAWLV